MTLLVLYEKHVTFYLEKCTGKPCADDTEEHSIKYIVKSQKIISQFVLKPRSIPKQNQTHKHLNLCQHKGSNFNKERDNLLTHEYISTYINYKYIK